MPVSIWVDIYFCPFLSFLRISKKFGKGLGKYLIFMQGNKYHDELFILFENAHWSFNFQNALQ